MLRVPAEEVRSFGRKTILGWSSVMVGCSRDRVAGALGKQRRRNVPPELQVVDDDPAMGEILLR